MVYTIPKVFPTCKVGSRDADASKKVKKKVKKRVNEKSMKSQ